MEPKYIFENGVMLINPKYKPLDCADEKAGVTTIERKVISKPLDHPKTSSSLVIQRLLMTSPEV